MNPILITFLAAGGFGIFEVYNKDYKWTDKYFWNYCVKPTRTEFLDQHTAWNTGLGHRAGDNPWGPR